MENEHWCVRSGGIDLLQRRHTPLFKLELAPTAYHADPLRRWRPSCLVLQHRESFCERGHAIPPQLHVVVETTANGMHVGINQAWNHGPLMPVDQMRFRPAQTNNFFIGAEGGDFSLHCSNCLNERRVSIG